MWLGKFLTIEYLQWVAALICIIGLVLNVKKDSRSFLIWIAGNCIWIFIDIKEGLIPQAILFIIYSFFNLYGYLEWRNNGDRKP